MVEIEFNFEGEKINIQSKSDEKLKEIMNRFSIKADRKLESLYFLYGGKILNENLSFNEQASEQDKKRNTMSVIVSTKADANSEEDESFKRSKYIICPECNNNCRILIANYKITFYECKNGHKKSDIELNDFEQTQNYDESKIKCEFCKNCNKTNSYNNIFYICYDCNKNLCPLCKSSHDKTHKIVEYDNKFFICDLHNESYNSYCSDCKKDICLSCEMEHSEHKIISFGGILPNLKKIKEESNDLYNKIEKFKEDIRDIINKLNKLIEVSDIYFRIYQDIINSYENKKRNYSLLQNIRDMNKYNNDFIKDMNNILYQKNINDKLNGMITLYNKMIPIKATKDINIKKEVMNINPEEKNELKETSEEKKDNKDGKLNEIQNKKEKEQNSKINKNQVEINNELWDASESKQDNNYQDLDISKMKKILTLKTKIEFISKIFVMNDGRFLISGGGNYDELFRFIVFDLKKGINFKFPIDDPYSYDIIQMNDGHLIVRSGKGIKLINVKENEIETLNFFPIEVKRIFKLSEQKILMFGYDEQKYLYVYENGKLIEVNKKKLKTLEKIYISEKEIYPINENEVAIFYEVEGIFNSTYYLGFFDLEKDKRIQYFKDEERGDADKLCLINENLMIYGGFKKLYPIHLKNHSKKKPFILESGTRIQSIFSLNEKQFIVSQEYYINQFELEKDNTFNLIKTVSFDHGKMIKYPKNRFIIVKNNVDDIIYLYG